MGTPKNTTPITCYALQVKTEGLCLLTATPEIIYSPLNDKKLVPQTLTKYNDGTHKHPHVQSCIHGQPFLFHSPVKNVKKCTNCASIHTNLIPS